MTTTPASVAAARSIESVPTPTRAMALSCGAAANTPRSKGSVLTIAATALLARRATSAPVLAPVFGARWISSPAERSRAPVACPSGSKSVQVTRTMGRDPSARIRAPAGLRGALRKADVLAQVRSDGVEMRIHGVASGLRVALSDGCEKALVLRQVATESRVGSCEHAPRRAERGAHGVGRLLERSVSACGDQGLVERDVGVVEPRLGVRARRQLR